MKPGYKQTEIGVIPEDWEIHFLPYYGDVLSGGTPSTSVSEYWNGDIAWCTPSDITAQNGTTIAKTEKNITETGLLKSAATLLPAGSLLLCTRATIGDSKINSVPMATNQGFKNIVPRNCDVYYLFYLLQTKKKEMLEKAIGSTFLEISKSALCSIPLQYPKISEQKRIAEALSDMDELIASIEKLIAKKKAIKKGAMQELLTGRRRLPGFSGEWESKLYGDVFSILPNNAFTRDQLSTGGKIKNIHYGDILTKYGACVDGCDTTIPTLEKALEGKKFAEKCFLQSGDVIIADTAEDLTVGKAVEIVNVCSKVLAGQHTFLCRPIIPFAPMFLGYYINSADFHDQIVPFVTGTKVSSINKASLCSLTVRYPDIPEQKAIVDTLSSMDQEIKTLEGRLKKAGQIKRGMMQQLLTGKNRLIEERG